MSGECELVSFCECELVCFSYISFNVYSYGSGLYLCISSSDLFSLNIYLYICRHICTYCIHICIYLYMYILYSISVVAPWYLTRTTFSCALQLVPIRRLGVTHVIVYVYEYV